MAQVLNCCKKWLNGRVVKFMSMSPCTGGAVPCHEADPVQAGTQAEDRPTPDKEKPDAPMDPIDDEVIPPDQPKPTFCAGGHRLKQGVFVPGAPGMGAGCGEGFKVVYNNADGWTWCCPEEGGNGDGDGDQTTTPGCIPITKDYVGGKGAGAAFWNDPAGIIPANTVLRSGDWQGHMVWHVKDKKYYLVEDLQDFYQGKADMPKGWNKACPKGWHKVGQECCPDAAETDTGVAGEAPGWWDWPENLKALFARIEERINFMYDNPRGLTDAEKQTIANYATQRIKRGERGEIQATQNWLARSGLAGSGPELEEIQRIRRGTREDVAGVQSEIAIDDARRRFSELMQTSQMASGMTGQLAGFETITESINAARRGEGRMDMQMMLQFLSMLLGGQDDSYNQAMINWMIQQGQ